MKQAFLNLPEQRRFRVALSVFFFISGIRFATWACRIPDIQNMLHLNNAGLGAVLLALPVGSLSGLPISGYLVTKYGSRKMLLVSALTLPIPMIGIGLSVNSYLLAVNLFLFGLTGNLLNISVNTQAVAVEKIYGRSIMASFHGLWSLGGFSGAAFGTWMMTMHIVPLIHFCIVSVLCLGGMFLFYNHTIEDEVHKKKEAKAFNKPDVYLMVLGIIAFSSMVCEGTMFDWSGVYFDKVINVKEGLITLGYVAFMFTMASGRFLGDRLITNFGTTTVLRGSGIIIFTGLITSVLFPNIITATIGFMLVGMGVSSVVPIAYAMAGKSKKLAPGAAIASVSSIGFLGFLLGPPLIGFIAQASSLRWSFTVIGCLGLVMFFMANKLPKQE
ncbi:MAG: MFS transporter [Chitinophaga sp.]|jgi:MFS family permease|nr:MFS transporter [Chitinophaga sp.]